MKDAMKDVKHKGGMRRSTGGEKGGGSRESSMQRAHRKAYHESHSRRG